MKNFILLIVSILFCLPVRAENTAFEKDTISIKGDANVDGVVNVADIVETVNYIKGNPSDKFNKAFADVNDDGTVNDEDIKTIGKIIFAHPTYKLMCLSPKVEMERGKSASAKISFKLLHNVEGQWVDCPDKTLIFSAKDGVCTPTSVKTDSEGIGQTQFIPSDGYDGATGGSITAICTIEIDPKTGFDVNLRQTTELPQELMIVLLLTAGGGDNHTMVTDETVSIIKNNKSNYSLEGSIIETYPVISIQDDDAIDYQLPQSYSSSATSSTKPSSSYQNWGGFSSFLWPVLKALNTKHAATINGKITCGVASEGQRIGLTPLYGLTDTFTGDLNTCGKMIKALVEKEGWECILHSMTARYISNSYLVNGLDSEFAKSLLIDATYSGTNGLGWKTTTCYDTVTKNNYKVKKDLSGWEECPVHYAKPYLALTKASNSPLVINPTYSFEYQVKTWKDRAEIANLPYNNILVVWGNSHGSLHVNEDMKYVDAVLAVGGVTSVNTVPFRVCPNRNPLTVSASSNGITVHTDDYNVYNKDDYEKLIGIIDECIETGGWSILRGHAYEAMYRNEYRSYFADYGTQHLNLYGADAADCGPLCYYDMNYPSEWIQPLKYAELMDMIGDNVNDYWNNPPARLKIQSWADWYPCPGTTMAMVYDVLEYAISKGVRFDTAENVLKERGNLFAIGCETIRALAPDTRLPENEQFHSFCRIGADGSLMYISK